MDQPRSPTIAVIGGTGQEGSGLTLRWAASGFPVIIGSREQEKAARKAVSMNEQLGESSVPVRGLSNRDAAEEADVAMLVVPYAAQKAILADIREAVHGKLLMTAVVPLDPDDPKRILVPAAGSAAAEAQEMLGPETPVVTAFQNVGAHAMQRWDQPIECDILVCGDDAVAKRMAMNLVAALGLRALDAGPLTNAITVEGLTPILIGLNIQHRTRHAGIRITGLP